MRAKHFLATTATIVAIAVCSSVFGAETCIPTSRNRPVCPANATPEAASFIDPTAQLTRPAGVTLGAHSYIAPFAQLLSWRIDIGEASNLQDSVRVDGGRVAIGDEVILAHGARVTGPARIGRHAVEGEANAAFVGFNSWVRGAKVEHDAMVLHLARVNPGITIKQGKVVLSGKDIRTQAEADDLSLGKVVDITEALRIFMQGVLHVNETFAREYTRMFRESANTVRGINFDPGNSDFNLLRNLPTLAGVPTQNPGYRNRIIGDVVLADSLAALQDDDLIGRGISLRADEGEPFHLGHIARMADRVTFHALEHTGLDVHDYVRFGKRSLVHGGASAATLGNPHSNTVVGSRTRIGDRSVVFRSVIGENVRIGCASLVDGSTIVDGAVIPARTVVINNAPGYPVEWNPGCPT